MPEPEERTETTQEGMAADEGADGPVEAAPGPARTDSEVLGRAGRDYVIPGVDPADPNPYKWHTGEKRDHGGHDAIEIIDLVKQFGRMRILNECNLGLPDN
ncbi:MAG TPA: hypothetical protein VHI76_02745, partial [Solirubrobacterales bacterium]|nr:hypothetical protein [Solirubrobacterales bacterium]